MKKLINRLRKRNNLPPPSRITSETIDQHREHILAGGRKFKYPIQYARHKLVINAILISLSAVIIAIVIGWWQLYPAQNTSEFIYRVTKIIPVPVAVVDGQPVLYSDYLMKYLSSVHYIDQKEQVSLKTDSGKRQIEYIKQKSMQDAIADAYAVKLSKRLNLTVSTVELEGFLKEQRQTSDGEISEQTYDAVILDYYGWSPAEYRHVTEGKLLRQKVAYALDKDALNIINSVGSALKSAPLTDFKTLSDNITKQSGVKTEYSTSGWVPKFNQDGGLSVEAAKLKKQDVSSVIKSTTGDGYYVVRLLDINDSQVKYESIKVPLTAFTKALADIEKHHKVTEFISIPKQAGA